MKDNRVDTCRSTLHLTADVAPLSFIVKSAMALTHYVEQNGENKQVEIYLTDANRG